MHAVRSQLRSNKVAIINKLNKNDMAGGDVGAHNDVAASKESVM